MSTAAEIAHAFSAKPSGDGWMAHCPLHNDNTESFSIGEGSTGKVLLHCFAGCSQEALVAEVRRRGYEPDGILGSKPHKPRAKPTQRNSKGSNRLIRLRRRPEPDDDDDDDDEPPPPRPPSPRPPPPPPPEEEPEPEEEPSEEELEPTAEGLRRPAKCDIEAYARKLNLTVDHLKEQGLTDGKWKGGPAIAIPYVDESGQEVAIRYRIRLTAADRFRWKTGDKTCLYGLSRIAEAREKGTITIVEGESDCLTLWWENFDAVGVPGASNWQEERDARHFDGFGKIYVVIESDAGGEPDAGGKTVLKWLAESSIRDRTHLVFMPKGTKDPAALYQSNPMAFTEAWPRLLEQAQPWQAYASEANLEQRNAAKRKAARLLAHGNVLNEVVKTCHERGVVHEDELIQLTYLVVTSRILDRIVSEIVKGPSSAGKSFVIRKVLDLFPSDAYYAWTSMSERALLFSDQPLSHKIIVFYEAAGMGEEGSFLAYLVRTLLSEDRLTYSIVEKIGGKHTTRVVTKEGPTGLILTTTELAIEAQNETRCLSIPATETPEQTAAIMMGQAKWASARPPQPDLSEFHALQTYLALERVDVDIPFSKALAKLIPPVAIRLRRDFQALLSLIQTHALLHQSHRERDENGRLIADVVDYVRVRRLMTGLISDAAGITVPATVRETRQVVADLLAGDRDDEDEPGSRRRLNVAPKKDFVSLRDIEKVLKLDRSTINRRVNDAIRRGYLKNLEEKIGRPYRITLGDPIGEDESLLPDRAALLEEMKKWAP
jgi:hypothetical protein